MASRREFIRRTLGVGLALGASACATEMKTSRRVIVDAQVHVWPASSPALPWVPGAKPPMAEPFTIEKAVPLMDEAGVDRVVIVTPAVLGHNNAYSLDAARRYPARFAVMGRIDQRNRQAAALFPKWREQPGMLGIRITFSSSTSRATLTDGSADWIWPAAEKAGLPIMVLTTAQAAAFGPIAERHPGLQIIVDHMGVSANSTREGKRDDAFAQTVSLAKYPNVSVKLSAIGDFSAEPWPWPDSAPYIRRLIDAYGPRRCYWGTDITSSFAKASYHQRITQFTEELGFLSEQDKDWVMGRGIRERLGWS